MDDEKPLKIRKQRIDTLTEEIRVAQGASKNIEPPENIFLEDEEMIFFERIINEKAKADWTPHMIDMASFLARAMHSLNRNSKKLSLEGDLIKDAKGNIVANPRKKMVEDSIASIVSTRRNLGIHARGTGGEAREVLKRDVMAKHIENLIGDDDDGLLAMPEQLN